VVLTTILRGRLKKATFIDSLRIYVRGGAGGQGFPKFGGIGGKGGNVYLVAEHGARSLRSVRGENDKLRYIANNGANSTKRALLGEAGADKEIPVPPGVVAFNDAGRNLGELNEVGDRLLVTVGGAGGGPENNFMAQKGASTSVKLDLKLIADIGLVGFPNAGKSTFLSAISRAAPKIAAYPFTTIQPQIGTMVYDDMRQIQVADLPGLIEGAHVNVGMGHHFLKHVERTKLLLFMVDLHGFQLNINSPVRSALETILLLNKELELYKEDLLSKPCVLALNKKDLPGSEKKLEEIIEQVNNLPEFIKDLPEHLVPENLVSFDEVISISARKQMDTQYLKDSLRHWLDVDAELELNLGPEKTLPASFSESAEPQSTVKSKRWKRLSPEEQRNQKLKEHFDGGHYV